MLALLGLLSLGLLLRYRVGAKSLYGARAVMGVEGRFQVQVQAVVLLRDWV